MVWVEQLNIVSDVNKELKTETGVGLSGQVAIKLCNDVSQARTQMRKVVLIEGAPGEAAPGKEIPGKRAPGEFKNALKRSGRARQLRHTCNFST